MTSDVLNNSKKRTLVNKEEPEQEPCTKRVCGEEDNENRVHPAFQISGGSNITINCLDHECIANCLDHECIANCLNCIQYYYYYIQSNWQLEL